MNPYHCFSTLVLFTTKLYVQLISLCMTETTCAIVIKRNMSESKDGLSILVAKLAWRCGAGVADHYKGSGRSSGPMVA
jgi:hypothetical protein